MISRKKESRPPLEIWWNEPWLISSERSFRHGFGAQCRKMGLAECNRFLYALAPLAVPITSMFCSIAAFVMTYFDKILKEFRFEKALEEQLTNRGWCILHCPVQAHCYSNLSLVEVHLQSDQHRMIWMERTGIEAERAKKEVAKQGGPTGPLSPGKWKA